MNTYLTECSKEQDNNKIFNNTDWSNVNHLVTIVEDDENNNKSK